MGKCEAHYYVFFLAMLAGVELGAFCMSDKCSVIKLHHPGPSSSLFLKAYWSVGEPGLVRRQNGLANATTALHLTCGHWHRCKPQPSSLALQITKVMMGWLQGREDKATFAVFFLPLSPVIVLHVSSSLMERGQEHCEQREFPYSGKHRSRE